MVKEGMAYAMCPRCEGTGIEPTGIQEIVVTVRTFLSFSRQSWITSLDVGAGSKDHTKAEIISLFKDVLRMLESNEVILLPSKEDRKQ